MSDPAQRIAVITGASGGIGGAVAAALAARGVRPCLAGRDPDRLRRVADELSALGARPSVVRADLRSDDDLGRLVAAAEALGRVDVLFHGAGTLRLGDVVAAAPDDLDELYRVNVRAPYLLTKALLPLLVASRGQVVFVNSSAALRPGGANAVYAATKAALLSLTGSIRDRVNPLGVRVLSVFPGRTATRMLEEVVAFERGRLDPEAVLDPRDVAEVVVHALLMPASAEITDVMVRPMKKRSDA